MARSKRDRKEVFDDHMALSYEEVRGVLKFFSLPERDFSAWMNGQTGPMSEDGNIGVYWYDLNRYIRWKKQGVEPIFD